MPVLHGINYEYYSNETNWSSILIYSHEESYNFVLFMNSLISSQGLDSSKAHSLADFSLLETSILNQGIYSTEEIFKGNGLPSCYRIYWSG